jgi:hypothetical protein
LFERWPVVSHREDYRGDDVKSALQSGVDVPSRLRAHAIKQSERPAVPMRFPGVTKRKKKEIP